MEQVIFRFLKNLFLNYGVIVIGVYVIMLPFALVEWYYMVEWLRDTDAVGVGIWMFIGSFTIANIFIATFYFFTLLFWNVPLVWNNKILILLAAIPPFFAEEIKQFIGYCPSHRPCFFTLEELLIIYIPCLFLYFLFQKQIQAQTKRFSSFWGRVFFGE